MIQREYHPRKHYLAKLLLFLMVTEFSLVQFSSVVSDSLWPHELQHARPPWPSPTPGVHPNPCPLCWWCHPTISSSFIPFSSCPQFFPSSGSFQMSQLFASGGQSTGVSASTSVLPMNTQDWSPLGWIGWISFQSKGLSRGFSNTTVKKCQFFWCSAFFIVQLSHPYMTTWKTVALTRRTFVGKVMSLLLNMLSGHNFPSKEQVSFNFMAAVTICSDFGAPQNKVSHCFHYFPIYLPWSDGTRCHDLSFLNVGL